MKEKKNIQKKNFWKKTKKHLKNNPPPKKKTLQKFEKTKKISVQRQIGEKNIRKNPLEQQTFEKNQQNMLSKKKQPLGRKTTPLKENLFFFSKKKKLFQERKQNLEKKI